MATWLDSINIDSADAEALEAWWAATLDWPMTRYEWTDGQRVTFELSVDPPPGRPAVSLFRQCRRGEGRVQPDPHRSPKWQ
jgi:hypothetical protein